MTALRACNLACCIAFGFACFSGCSTQPYEGRSAKVAGRVTLGGSPLTAGNVLFMMDDGHAANSPLGSDGTYSVDCRPGKYKVAVTPPELIDPLAASGEKGARVLIPNKYLDLGNSGLIVELKPGDNTYDIPMSK